MLIMPFFHEPRQQTIKYGDVSMQLCMKRFLTEWNDATGYTLLSRLQSVPYRRLWKNALILIDSFDIVYIPVGIETFNIFTWKLNSPVSIYSYLIKLLKLSLLLKIKVIVIFLISEQNMRVLFPWLYTRDIVIVNYLTMCEMPKLDNQRANAR